MTIVWAIVFFILGIALMAKAADIFIDAATWFAKVTGISKAVIGATVVAFATSAPELFVSLFAALKGSGDMSTANIIGSCICNLGIGLALIATMRPANNKGDTLFSYRGIVLIVMMVLLFLFCLNGFISIIHGVVFLLIYIYFTYINIRNGSPEKPEKKKTNKKEIILNTLMFILGLAGVLFGAEVVVNNAKNIAFELGVSEMLVGLTIVAVGTSAPEIMTTIVAIVKKESDLGVGNLIGSNIFDILIFAPITFISGNIAITSGTTFIDIPFALLLTLIAVLPTMITKKIHRWQGIALGTLYILYTVFLIVTKGSFL